MRPSLDLAERLASIIHLQHEILAAALDLSAVAALAARKTEELVGATGATIELLDAEDLICHAGSGIASSLIGTRMKIANTLSERAMNEANAVRSDDLELDSNIDCGPYRKIGARSMIVAPLIESGPVGVLKAVSRHPNAFDDFSAYSLQLIAGMIASAIAQASAYEAKRASEQRYRMLFEKNVAGVFRSTLSGEILDCNESLVRTLGYDSKEDLLSRKSWELYENRDDRERLIDLLKKENAATDVRIRLKKKNGSPVNTVINISLIPGEDGETFLLGTCVEAMPKVI